MSVIFSLFFGPNYKKFLKEGFLLNNFADGVGFGPNFQKKEATVGIPSKLLKAAGWLSGLVIQ